MVKAPDFDSGIPGSNPGVPANGQLAEWLKAAVLKTVDVQASVGSNPTLSAIWRLTQVGEGDGLLNR